MYNFSDLIKYEVNRPKAPSNSLAEVYWQNAVMSRAVCAKEYQDSYKTVCENIDKYGQIDPVALDVAAQSCPRQGDDDMVAVHLRLGDAMDRADQHLALAEISQIMSNVGAKPNVHFFAGVHNGKNVEKSEKHLEDLQKTFPGAVVHYSKEHNAEEVDRSFCEMLHAKVFVKSYGGFSERISQARCNLGLPVFELGKDELQPFDCSRTTERVPPECC